MTGTAAGETLADVPALPLEPPTMKADASKLVERGGISIVVRVSGMRRLRYRLRLVRFLLWLVQKVAPLKVEVRDGD